MLKVKPSAFPSCCRNRTSSHEASRLALGPELATALPKVVLISNPADQAISELYPAAERGSHRSTEADPDSNRFDLLPVLDR